MESIALINDRKGGYSMTKLPGQMQWAPVFSFASGDFNRDGKTDILAGGNFYGVIPYEGRYDAMPLVFGKGNGKGNFESGLPVEPALLIDGEIKDIKMIRLKNRQVLLVTRHNLSMIVLSY